MLAAWEPFFSFQAHIPPHRLADLSVGQIAAHISYWNQANRGGSGG